MYLEKRCLISTLLQDLCLGGDRVIWLVGVLGLINGPLRQYFSLHVYRVLSQREGDRGEKG